MERDLNGDGFFYRVFFHEKIPFSDKRDLNWGAIKWTLASLLGLFLVAVLFMPAEPEPTDETLAAPILAATERTFEEAPPATERHLSQYYTRSSPSAQSQAPSRQGSMIIQRGGLDFRNQLPPGTRIKVRLIQGAIVSTESMPIIVEVVEDVPQESTIAIERGSKLYGEASFDDSGDVAQVTWSAIQLADNRERQISAIGVSRSGHVGVQGKLHSKRAQNIAGSTISRLIGAYAEGSVSRGVLGFSQGGAENGLKTAVAETAKDQADSYASDLKKEKRWIELQSGQEFLAVLKQPFTFRDPGSYAR